MKKNKCNRKILAFGFIILFIGLSIIPSTYGNNKEKTTRVTFCSRDYIQDLINNASDGDTIYIPSGTYYENIIINKSISLVGEDKNTTIIDYGGDADAVSIVYDWVNISGFTIQNSTENAILLNTCNNCTIFDIVVLNSNFAITLIEARHNQIKNCEIHDNMWGINIAGNASKSSGYNSIISCEISNNFVLGLHLFNCGNNIVYGNSFISDGIAIAGSVKDCIQDIDNTNTVNGKPLYYFLNEKNVTIDGWDVGELILVNCTNFLIKNIEICNTETGIEVAYCSNITFLGCKIHDVWYGIFLMMSSYNVIEHCSLYDNRLPLSRNGPWWSNGISIVGSNNIIKNNNISNNVVGIIVLSFFDLYSTVSKGNIIEGNNLISNSYCGIYFSNSSENFIYYNNFIDNEMNAYDDGTNIWDDGKKGNYWDDYEKKYPNARKIYLKGIWNIPYDIEGDSNKDRYPLIKQWPYPEGRIIFSARSRGPCGVAWGYIMGNESTPTPDAYIEPAKGFIFNFGFMLYYSLYGFYSNYLIEGINAKKLWPLRQRTFIDLRWQHENVKYNLGVICKPLEETTGSFFTDPKIYLISPPPTFEGESYLSNCMKFNGFFRNGTKIEGISGFAVLFAIAKSNTGSVFTDPAIIINLFQKKEGGEIEPILVALWSKNGMELLNTTIERAKTFHVNFWTLKLLFSS